jgi:excisionase family DNA binding protein
MTTATPELAALLAQLAEALARQPQRQAAPPEPRPMPERVLLTVEEAAKRLGIGRSMAFRLIRDREIESVQIGRLRRIPASAVNEYAARLIAQQSPNATTS